MNMKKILRWILFLVLMPGGIINFHAKCDPPSEPPPPPGGGHGSGGNEGPAGAPIDGGLGILFLLGTAVGGIKLFQQRREGANRS